MAIGHLLLAVGALSLKANSQQPTADLKRPKLIPFIYQVIQYFSELVVQFIRSSGIGTEMDEEDNTVERVCRFIVQQIPYDGF